LICYSVFFLFSMNTNAKNLVGKNLWFRYIICLDNAAQ
jgi:hypothetical protein